MALLLAAALAVLPLSGCGEVKQTNEGLTIYASAETINYWNRVLNGYRYAYPDVAVDLVDLSDLTEREFSERLASELMSGKGPDLFIVGEEFMKLRDVYKLMDSGAFADITEEIASHPELGSGSGEGISKRYNQTVMEQGVWNEKRYLMPICYRFPILLTSQGILDESGFDVGQCGDFMGFVREAQSFVGSPKNEEQRRRLFGSGMAFANYSLWMGAPIFDYQNQTVNLSLPELQETASLYQSLYREEQEGPFEANKLFTRWINDGNRGRVFENYEDAHRLFPGAASYVEAHGEMVAFPLRGMDGKIHAMVDQAFAVNANSPNVHNASNFIRIALEKYQYDGMIPCFPVQNAYVPDLWTVFRESNRSISFYLEFQYVDDNGDYQLLEGRMGSLAAISPEFIDEYTGWTQELGDASFYTPEQEKLYELMTPYYKGEADYETCIKKAQEQLTLYMTE